jgi:hypothetical protein
MNKKMIASIFTVTFCFLIHVSNAQLVKSPKIKTLGGKKTESSANSNSSENKSSSNTAPAAISQNTAVANKTFNDNKNNIDSCRKYLNEFNYERVSKNVLLMANNINTIIKQGEKIAAEIHTNIPDIAEFERSNEEAKGYHLKSKIGWLESDVEKAKTRFSDIKQYLLKDVDDNVYLSKMSEVSIQSTAKIMDDVNNDFAMLDKFFPNDADVDASRKTSVPAIKVEYDKKMKQVGSNKIAPSKYNGADKVTQEKKLAAAYNARYAGEVVKRVSITDPSWTQKTELIDDNTKVYWRTSSYIGAHVAVQKDKACKVYIVTFRKDKTTGEIELYSVGSNYPVLVENIMK